MPFFANGFWRLKMGIAEVTIPKSVDENGQFAVIHPQTHAQVNVNISGSNYYIGDSIQIDQSGNIKKANNDEERGWLWFVLFLVLPNNAILGIVFPEAEF